MEEIHRVQEKRNGPKSKANVHDRTTTTAQSMEREEKKNEKKHKKKKRWASVALVNSMKPSLVDVDEDGDGIPDYLETKKSVPFQVSNHFFPVFNLSIQKQKQIRTTTTTTSFERIVV